MGLTENRVKHMVGVAEYMQRHAWEYNLNPEDMYILGLLHDIGYLKGSENHEMNGKKLLFNFGLWGNKYLTYGYAIANHNKLPNEYLQNETFRVMKFLLDADMSIDYDGTEVNFERRLKNVAFRHGEDSEQYKNAESIVKWLGSSK